MTDGESRAMAVLTRYAEAQRANSRKVRVVLWVVLISAIFVFSSWSVLTKVHMSEDLAAVVAIVFLASFAVCASSTIIAVGFAIFRQPMMDTFMVSAGA